MTGSCKTCRYWRDAGTNDAIMGRLSESECRRYPPQQFTWLERTEDGNPLAPHTTRNAQCGPMTRSVFWCGEYKADNEQ